MKCRAVSNFLPHEGMNPFCAKHAEYGQGMYPFCAKHAEYSQGMHPFWRQTAGLRVREAHSLTNLSNIRGCSEQGPQLPHKINIAHVLAQRSAGPPQLPLPEPNERT